MLLDLFIDGNRTSATSGQYQTIRGPVTTDPLAEVAVARDDDVVACGHAAQAAFERGVPAAHERSTWLLRTAAAMARDTEAFTNALVLEVGKTVRGARAEVQGAVRALEYAAGEALRISGETIKDDVWPGSAAGMWMFTRREPAGPACAVCAFNAPLSQAVHKTAAALAAGCPVVVKPSPMTPLATSLFVDLLADSGVPDGWINLVFGGAEVGQSLFASRYFARYTFTGSRRVGLELVQRVGLRRAILEMGSNAPNIIHKDASMDSAIEALLDGAFATAGQVCIRPQRIFVHADICDQFVEAFVERIQRLTVGDPRDPKTDMGPMRTEDAAMRVAAWVAEAVSAGARLLVGGNRDGLYMEPTVLRDVPLGEKVVCEEIFGPVVVVEPYDSLDDAIDKANDSAYGLQAAVFSRDLATCMQVVERLRVGSVIVNDSSRLRIPHVPFGGVKESGWGREGGRLGVQEFTDLKTVLIRR